MTFVKIYIFAVFLSCFSTDFEALLVFYIHNLNNLPFQLPFTLTKTNMITSVFLFINWLTVILIMFHAWMIWLNSTCIKLHIYDIIIIRYHKCQVWKGLIKLTQEANLVQIIRSNLVHDINNTSLHTGQCTWMCVCVIWAYESSVLIEWSKLKTNQQESWRVMK